MKKYLTIWSAYVGFIFVVLLSTTLLTAMLFIAAEHFKLREYSRMGGGHVLIFILLISVVFGTFASAVASKRMVRFLYQIRHATRRVAAGDFSVRLDEGHKITEVNTLIKDFNKMVTDLGNIETLKDDFVTNVSHEIKTPVSAIEGCVELLKDESLTQAERTEYVSLMEISVKRLTTLTANILRLSKLNNQEILSDQVTYSLDEQIRQGILLLAHKIETKNLNLNIYLTPVQITANKELLMLVWTNLIDNAIKFSHFGGDISINLSAANGVAYVKITDYGSGMCHNTQKHIFQKFYQGNASRSHEGNGLGLALVKRIVDVTGGRIDVESKPDVGSVFTVELTLQ